ncbi:MAG: hypothetical protein HQK87_07245, partial [Nitrospinae bacterium]|nr:hypothetical protein [Nitrospinota bacterium]
MSDIYGIKMLGALQKGLDMRLIRQGVNAGNIANSETPGFKEKTVDFTSRLEEALGRKNGMAETHPGHLPNHHREALIMSTISSTV